MSNGDKFFWKAGDLNISQCALCTRKQFGPVCKVFPEQIPDAILLNQHDHRKPYPGDHGYRFRPIR